MPGPKMGPRPVDFDEGLIRQSPTFAKWLRLEPGEKLRYACRDFIRGHEQDEERLMRRIMIARRNNLRDHEILKRARKTQDPVVPAVVPATTQQSRATASSSISSEPPPLALPADVKQEDGAGILADHPTSSSSTTTKPVRKRRPAATFSDAQVAKEMDVVAVEATRSYKSWAALEEGAEFVYNQKYVKGKEGHDWLLRKNIWRRMRYRRENKKMVTQLKHEDPSIDELVNNKQKATATRPNPTSQENKQAVNGNASKASGKGDSLDTADGKKRGTRTRTRNNAGANGQRGNNKETAGNKRGAGDSSGSAKASKMPKLEEPPPPILDDNLPEDMPLPGLSSSPNNNNNNHEGINNNPEDPTHAALTAAAAATASGGADDLVELSAVEAAVAAAATYVQLATQQHEVNTADDDDDDDDDDDGEVNDDLDPAPVVHNPLEAAANAAALDSAAKLAAATTAQDAHLDEDDEGRMEVSI